MATVAPRTILQATSGVTPLASASPAQVFAGQQIAALGVNPTVSNTGAEPRPLRIYITDIILTNSAATAAVVTLVDGASNVIFAANMPATSSQIVANMTTPLRGTPNTALNIQSSSASANINWTIVGYAAQ